MAQRMCFLGMGQMGKAMSRNLATKSSPESLSGPLYLWSRTISNAESHSKSVPNTTVCHTAADAVSKSDIIWSCLSDDEAVNGMFEGILRAADVEGKVFVECSTISPETTRAVAEKVEAKGSGFIAMPVFGEPSMAAASVLTVVPAGKKEHVDRIRPYLIGVLGRAIIDYSDESPEKSTLLKIVGNTFIINMIEALAEGHTLAEKSGLGTVNLEKFLEIVFPGPYMVHSKHMTSGRYHHASPIGNVAMVKGVAEHVLDLAASCGTKLPAYETARKQMNVLEDTKGPAADIDGLYGTIRMQSGLKFEN